MAITILIQSRLMESFFPKISARGSWRMGSDTGRLRLRFATIFPDWRANVWLPSGIRKTPFRNGAKSLACLPPKSAMSALMPIFILHCRSAIRPDAREITRTLF